MNNIWINIDDGMRTYVNVPVNNSVHKSVDIEYYSNALLSIEEYGQFYSENLIAKVEEKISSTYKIDELDD